MKSLIAAADTPKPATRLSLVEGRNKPDFNADANLRPLLDKLVLQRSDSLGGQPAVRAARRLA